MDKIIYFTAGAVATGPELAAIAALNAVAEAPYEIAVRRGDGVGSMSYGAGVEPADYVAGTPPAPYNSGYPVFDPANPPAPPTLPATQAVVANNQELVVPVTGSYATKAKVTVVAGVVTAIVLS